MTRSELTRQKLLEAAEVEFAEVGLYGARVDTIAARAGTNKRMIYAYFGNKEQLYTTVLSHVYARMAKAEQDWPNASLPPAEQIARVIHLYFDFLHRDSNFVRMLMWENLNHADYIRATDAANLKSPALRMLAETIQDGMERGDFRRDLDVDAVVLSINMSCFSYFSNIHTLSHLTGRDLTAEEAVYAYANHITEMILRDLTA